MPVADTFTSDYYCLAIATSRGQGSADPLILEMVISVIGKKTIFSRCDTGTSIDDANSSAIFMSAMGAFSEALSESGIAIYGQDY